MYSSLQQFSKHTKKQEKIQVFSNLTFLALWLPTCLYLQVRKPALQA
jgi:hypothetical protein